MTLTKTIFGKVFSRIAITGFLILFQCGWYAIILLKFAAYASWITFFFVIFALLLALFVIWRNDNPAYKMGWILLICLLPILGATMYVFFGNKRPAKRLKRTIDAQEKLHTEDLRQREDIAEINSTRLSQTIEYLANKGPYPAWTNTKTKFYPLGDDAYPDMLMDMRSAEHFIFMEYFIISEGKMWREIYEILKEKAAAGVDVRLIYDDVGSISTLPKGFLKELRANGIKVFPFNPMKPILSLVYNNRDHRKILVIDGYIGYSGGYNIADEYINHCQRFGHWKDNGIRLIGEAVWNFTVMFLNMWNAFEKTDDDYTCFGPHVHHPAGFESDGIIQPFSDTPLDDENIGENVYLEILSQAENYVYIYTPYLILDNEMMTALILAAKRGVDVRLVTPGIPDKKIIFGLTKSYYRPLIEGGVRVYRYTPGFIHAKSYISDDRIGVVGTINMDYRSLFLHFECGTLMIGCEALYGLKQDCLKTFAVSQEIQEEDCRASFFGILFEGVLRALSPLL